MRVFLYQNKTILPRLDAFYLATRLGVMLAVGWFGWTEHFFHTDTLLAWGVLGTYVAHLAVFYGGIRGRLDLKLGYLSSIAYDLLVIPIVILYTGGLQSSFYLLFFLTISVAAYMLRFWIAATVVALVSLLYLAAIRGDLTLQSLHDVVIRIGFFVVYYLALSYVSQHMRRSERRLLSLFDTLNMRTSELEKSQAQLEMIYENSRNLASILDRDGVVKEVVRILGTVMGYSSYGIILRDRKDQYVYRARSVAGQVVFQPLAIDAERMPLVKKVCDLDEPIRVKDIRGRHTFEPLSAGTRSVMVVPMNSHRWVNGALTVEASQADQFQERDLQMASIVARSAALALENAELHKRTEELTIIDGLTGAYNYRYFVQKLQEEKRRASRYDLPLSLIMVDIDWFKRLNDTYGHEAGNRVLATLAKVIAGCIRDVDIFARYGGEEFAIILPQTTRSEALVLGERIRERVEKTGMDAGNWGEVQITVSVGVSSYPENGRSQEELVSVADQALYRAKGEGRNQVCVL